ncbi:DUF559 domain-containing protein [Catenuloplanes japonicus]|uniref:DUF559 domain-containing protein n=1 Tax=Catenuloplanes japonicus TaxID=33876 RepID=UPI0005267EFF|nr:DUF559 domain-containing protein [Catenuloplanes japonicus]
MNATLAGLPADRVVQVRGGDAGRIALLAARGGPDLPAVLSHRFRSPGTGPVAGFVGKLLDDLEGAAFELFPAWLPGAEHIDSPGGAGLAAVRALAASRAAGSAHFGPFLADLAAGALSGVPLRRRFSSEIRAKGLARAVADGLGRARLVLVAAVPEGLSADEERTLVSGAEWLADRAGIGIWLCGTPLTTIDRLTVASIPDLDAEAPTRPDPGAGPRGTSGGMPGAAVLTADGLLFAGVIGQPHPRSGAERALEAALARQTWARGRAWNQTYQSHALASPVRLDLLWRTERCVVEIDGPEHCRPEAFEADRQRDVQLQLDGFAVLRFTNHRIGHDVEAVVRQIGTFIHHRRHELLKGHQP